MKCELKLVFLFFIVTMLLHRKALYGCNSNFKKLVEQDFPICTEMLTELLNKTPQLCTT
jgi:hypothetical protein